MRISNLDTQLLRSFVAIQDAGGFAKAADLLHMTQPAISQQMRRLEELIGQPLFQRDGRLMRLTSHGEALLGYARRIIALNDEAIQQLGAIRSARHTVTVGITEHFLDDVLHRLIARSVRELPDLRLVVRTGTSQRLSGMLELGEIDIAVTLEMAEGGRSDCVRHGSRTALLHQLPTIWVGANDGGNTECTARTDKAPRQLVLFTGQCLLRKLVLSSLEAAGQSWQIAYESDDLNGLRAAVRANLGITALPAQRLPDDIRQLTNESGLPPLPDCSLQLHYRATGRTTMMEQVGQLIVSLCDQGDDDGK